MRPTFILSVAALSAAAWGCGDGAKPQDVERSANAGTRVDTQSIVLVEGVYGDRRTSATGVIYDVRRGLALTANHPIEAAPTILVSMPDGRLMSGRMVARAQCHDMAVLKLRPRPAGVRPITFGNSGAAGVGAPVTTMSFGLKSAATDAPTLTSIRGTIAAVGVRETFAPLPPMDPLIAHQSPLGPGASGSPLLNARAQMIGINTLVAHPREGGLPGIEYALTSNYIRARLRELRPAKAGALGGWQREHHRCHGRLHRLIATGHTGGGAGGQAAPGTRGTHPKAPDGSSHP